MAQEDAATRPAAEDEIGRLLGTAHGQLEIMGALCRSYTDVFIADFNDEKLVVMKHNGHLAEQLDGAAPDALPYHSVLLNYTAEFVHPEDRAMFVNAVEPDVVRAALSEKEEYTGNYRVLTGDETHHFQFRFTPIGDSHDTRHSRVVAGFQNVDAVVAEETKDRQVLTDALIAAEHSNRAKTTFLNNMSHDIRTPMNAIIGFTSLAATHIDNKEQVAGYLRKIQTSSNHLLSLINDVLDMSRIESGKMRIEESEANLSSIMHDLKVIVQADIAAKQLDFFIDTVDIANEAIICDKLRLNQVLLNLLSNSVKFTEPGGFVSVSIAQKPKAPSGFADYEFRVKDSGIGMSPEFVNHVFEAFERERTSTVSGTQGTGLGMAITKNIVDMMGGTIDVHSELGRGTEFVVNLRFKTAENAVKEKPIPELQGLRALVADDNLHTCTSVAKMLSRIGMRADWTLSGKEAVHRARFAFEEADEYYAYIIDWLMPDMNGIECVRRIRSFIGDSKPIIILTAYDWSDIEQEAREAGVTAFCSKPLFMSELRKLLGEPFEQADAPAPSEENPDFTGRRILLAEDNELNQEIAVEILSSVGFEIETARNGEEALNAVENAQPGHFDLVLMDIQMPLMDGYDATRAIRALEQPGRSDVPILAMTANTFEEDKQRAASAGMDGHISKPIDLALLVKTLEGVLA